jgi:hypothetical protein
MGNNSMSWTIIKKPDYVNPFKYLKKNSGLDFFKSRRRCYYIYARLWKEQSSAGSWNLVTAPV